MTRATVADLPEVTDAHRRDAFASLCLAGITYEAAMQDDTRRRIVEARAHQLRTRQWKAEKHRAIQQHIEATMRANRSFYTTGHLDMLADHPGRRFWATPAQDLKRAAAGDRDD